MYCIVLQCDAVSCYVLQCVAACCSVLQCVAVCCSVLQCVAVCCSVMQCVAVCCSVLYSKKEMSSKIKKIRNEECVAVNYEMLRCSEEYCSHKKGSFSKTNWELRGVLQCVAVCCSVLQSPKSLLFQIRIRKWGVCCSVLQCVAVCCSVLQCVAVCCSV